MHTQESDYSSDRTATGGAVETFVQHRPLIFAIAYRMLGTVTDAEDMLQETFLRWQAVADAGDVVVRSPKQFLAAVVTRLCIDHLRLARVQRESYIGPWLPEPLEMSAADDPTAHAELGDSLSLAFLVLLERLTPVERAVFLLHDIFAYEYTEIASMVGKSDAACRQLSRRARMHIAEARPRFPAKPEAQERLAREFARACSEGDMDALLATLRDDITLWADGGGKAQAARRPITGAWKVAHHLLGILKLTPDGMSVRPGVVNGTVAFIAELAGHPHSVLTLDIVDERISAIYLVANPEKLNGVRGAGAGTRDLK